MPKQKSSNTNVNTSSNKKRGAPKSHGNIRLSKIEQTHFNRIFTMIEATRQYIDIATMTFDALRKTERTDDIAMFQSILLRIFTPQNERTLIKAMKLLGSINSESQMAGGNLPTELPKKYPIKTTIAHIPTATKKERAPFAAHLIETAFKTENFELLRHAACYMFLQGWKNTDDLKRYFEAQISQFPPSRVKTKNGSQRYSPIKRYVATRFDMSPQALEIEMKACEKHPLIAPILKNRKSKSTNK
jgi:hypothetical protein